ncbi:MAG TPA: carbon-nitrogen hydrolase [Deltaproteobacteria bacterium]|nr:carbon-nitrogen hydrolase [Deltaproteobacteria bacterium]
MGQGIKRIRLHLVQFPSVLGSPLATLERLQKRLQNFRPRPGDWVLFPEMWPSGFSLENKERLRRENSLCRAWLRAFARRYRCYLSGSMLEMKNKRAFNTAYVFGPEGKRLASYQKIHLFEYGGEHRYFSAGTRPTVFSTPWGKIGLAICYDLRFPELFRILSRRGARLMLVPSAWPQERIDHFLSLLKARAIENLCFVAGINKVGPGLHQSAVTYGGHSAVFGPWGEKFGELGKRNGLLSVTLDLSEVERVRSRYPFLRSRVLS